MKLYSNLSSLKEDRPNTVFETKFKQNDPANILFIEVKKSYLKKFSHGG